VNFDAQQFLQSFGTSKLLVSLFTIFKSSLLYIEVWKRRWWLTTHQKESLLKLDNHQWYVAWFDYCLRREQFQIHSLNRENWRKHNCYLVLLMTWRVE